MGDRACTLRRLSGSGSGGMADIAAVLARWEFDVRQVRERMYRAPRPRERERWHAL